MFSFGIRNSGLKRKEEATKSNLAFLRDFLISITSEVLLLIESSFVYQEFIKCFANQALIMKIINTTKNSKSDFLRNFFVNILRLSKIFL